MQNDEIIDYSVCNLQVKKDIVHRYIHCAKCGKIIGAYYDDGVKSKIVDIQCQHSKCKNKNIVLI